MTNQEDEMENSPYENIVREAFNQGEKAGYRACLDEMHSLNAEAILGTHEPYTDSDKWDILEEWIEAQLKGESK